MRLSMRLLHQHHRKQTSAQNANTPVGSLSEALRGLDLSMDSWALYEDSAETLHEDSP